MGTPTTYTYSISTDFPNGRVEAGVLAQEIMASSIVTALDNVGTAGDNCNITFKDPLSVGDKATLDAVVAAHQGNAPPGEVQPVSIVDATGMPIDDSNPQVPGGIGTGTWMPNPSAQFMDYARGVKYPLQVQADGSMPVWATALTDAGSFRDDFAGSLISNLTGTCAFTAGSTAVTGVGTAFLTEINRFSYLKRSTHSESAWTGVGHVIDDTHLELAAGYGGATGSGTTNTSKWRTSTGSGGSISSANSLLTITSGTTLGASTYAFHGGDYAPMTLLIRFSISQRIANQTIVLGMLDDVLTPTACANIELTGIDNTRVTLVTRSGSGASDVERTTVRLPIGATTATVLSLQIKIKQDEVCLIYNDLDDAEIELACHSSHIPDPYKPMMEYVGFFNTGTPGSSTTLDIDVCSVNDYNELQTTAETSFIKEGDDLQSASYRANASRGTGGFYPSPECIVVGGEPGGAVPDQVDAAGSRMTRGPVLTDEESFRTDFPGSSLSTNLTGTCTFTNGSTTVYGSGTLFDSEVPMNVYLKRSTDGETTWQQVGSIISDTELELLEEYTGTSGSGTGQKTYFETRTGAGGSFAVASSVVTVAAGTTNGSRTTAFRRGDYGPMFLQCYLSLSQRIVNQEFYMGFVDDATNPGIRALAVFDGTDNTKVKLRVASSLAAADVEEVTASLPNGITSASSNQIELSVMTSVVYLTIDGVKVAEVRRHVPGPYDVMVPAFGFINTGVPATATTAAVDSFWFKNHDRIEVANTFRGDAIPVRTVEDVHTLFGLLTTTSTGADQVIASYVVPAGKYLFVMGYFMSSGDTTVNGSPYKIGKGALTEAASPGLVDGLVLRAGLLGARQSKDEQMTTPLYLAGPGETVKVTVTPDSTTSTVWRASLDFVLR